MSEYLFAYGTLQPDLAPADIAPLVARLKPIGEGSIRGILYNLDGYPGAQLDSESQHTIVGMIFELPADPEILRALDDYEEYNPAAPDASLFIRVQHPVTLASGATLTCWIYVWNGDPSTTAIIPGGRFR